MADNNTNTVINTDTARMTEKQKVKEITDKLEEGLKELFESEKYKSYLSTMSKFHNYSFNNIQLIAMQKPDATLVAGYMAWQKNFERHVNKGEKAIRILAPAPYKIKEERDKLDPVTGEMMFDENGMPQREEVEVKIPAFRVVSVFDVNVKSFIMLITSLKSYIYRLLRRYVLYIIFLDQCVQKLHKRLLFIC